MPELMGGHLKQIRTAMTVDRPLFSIIEMRITAVNREIRMSQCTARSIEWITISVSGKMSGLSVTEFSSNFKSHSAYATASRQAPWT